MDACVCACAPIYSATFHSHIVAAILPFFFFMYTGPSFRLSACDHNQSYRWLVLQSKAQPPLVLFYLGECTSCILWVFFMECWSAPSCSSFALLPCIIHHIDHYLIKATLYAIYRTTRLLLRKDVVCDPGHSLCWLEQSWCRHKLADLVLGPSPVAYTAR